MKNKEKLKKAERLEISILLNKKYSVRSIACALDRSPNTVSYEIKKNSVNGAYNSLKANAKARTRKRASKYQWKKIEQDVKLRKYIIKKLKKRWNPDEISGRMKLEKQPFYASKTTIYEWLRSIKGIKYCRYLYSKRYYSKKRKAKKTKREMIPDRTGIESRFKGADNRSRYGHWEKDAIVSGPKGIGALAVIQERKSRYVLISKTKTMSPVEHNLKTKEMINNSLVKSITYDNGIENKYHKKLNVLAFFCDPYSSWQKGSVENVNKMIRRYIPKGTNMVGVKDKYIQIMIDEINKKPRKILGYRTALEVAERAGVIKRECPN